MPGRSAGSIAGTLRRSPSCATRSELASFIRAIDDRRTRAPTDCSRADSQTLQHRGINIIQHDVRHLLPREIVTPEETHLVQRGLAEAHIVVGGVVPTALQHE